MNADAIRETLDSRPFAPFEVIMSSGERHLVRHPEFLMLLQSKIAIGDLLTDRLTVLSQTRVLQISVMYKRTEIHSWVLPRKAVHSGNLS